MKIILSELARDDLIDIGVQVSEYSPQRAARLVQEILDACESIADMPARYSRVPRFEHQKLRRRVFKGYVIAFKFDTKIVEVVRIVPGVMDIDKILFDVDSPTPD